MLRFLKFVLISFLVFLGGAKPIFSDKNPEQEDPQFLLKNGDALQSTLMNINNLSMWIREDGLSGLSPESDTLKLDTLELEIVSRRKGNGIVFPRGTARIVSQDGFLWGGLVIDGQNPEFIH